MQASQSLNLEFLDALPRDRDLRVEASPYVVSYAAQVDGKLHVFLSNFAGIVPHKNVRPTPESAARIVVTAGPSATLTFVPFLGTAQTVQGERLGRQLIFHLPPFDRGAVVWLNDSK